MEVETGLQILASREVATVTAMEMELEIAKARRWRQWRKRQRQLGSNRTKGVTRQHTPNHKCESCNIVGHTIAQC